MPAAPALAARVSGTVWRSRGTPNNARPRTVKATMKRTTATIDSSVVSKPSPCACAAS